MSIRTDAAAAVLLAMAIVTVAGNYPTFDSATEFRDLMVPAGAPVGSLIYRIRASDHDKDYPLYFQATGKSINEFISLLRYIMIRIHSYQIENIFTKNEQKVIKKIFQSKTTCCKMYRGQHFSNCNLRSFLNITC